MEDGPDYRPLLKEIQSSGESHIILDVDPDKIVALLRQASEVKMMEEYQSYIITSLDAHTIDFEELKFMRANITTMRLIDPTSFEVMNGNEISAFAFQLIKDKSSFQPFTIGSRASDGISEYSE